MNQPIHEVMQSLQRLSAVVLPELKRLSTVILASTSNDGITHAPTFEALLLDAHRIADAAKKSLAHLVKEDRDVQTRKPPLPVDVELEVLRFCSRVDLDKMQLVSKAKRTLVDDMSDRLALHNIYRVDARDPHYDYGKRCTVTYSNAQYLKEVSTDVREEILRRGDEANGRVWLHPSPFRRMRNAFVGAARFYAPEELTAEFKELLSVFIGHHKGAMQMGIVHLCYTMSAQWTSYLLGVAVDDLSAKCLVVTDYSDDCVFVDRILAAPTIRKFRRITVDAYARHESLYGAAQMARLAELATNCGDVRRIDIQLCRDDFARCLGQWIQALVSQKNVTKLVNNVQFHSEYDAELPSVLSEPAARLLKRKWQTTNADGTPCEMEDVEEKTVFAFKNENTSTQITAVVARYSYFEIFPKTSLTCNFIMVPIMENLDVGDFSHKHLKTSGLRWHEPLTDFD